ncbi:MAG: hypothetical protein JWQ89_2362 [Devosia sp.]|uniref:hypothetical protein n=1 Tax=Devosia sp. TaxID=1871048 RepID=UPI00261218A8|nr:hypothetical protein [Devosia sp.]MDB5540635.1 hypothetical protein [Devosia sp.]
MRIAALFLGLMAGLFALLAPSALRTDLMSPFLEMWSANSSERLLGTIVWYAIPAAALAGGLLATVTPGFAALLLLGAAVGWLGVGLSMPQHFNYQLIAPAAAAGLGALLAFLAGELQLRRRRMARRGRLAEAAGLDDNGEIEREAALRMDPLLMPRDEQPPPPRRTIPLTLDDLTVPTRAESIPLRWHDDDAPRPHRGGDDWAEVRRSPPPPQPPQSSRGEAQVRPEPRPIEVESRPVPGRSDRDIRPERLVQREMPPAKGRRGQGSALVAAMAAGGAVLALGLLLAGGYVLYRGGMPAGLPAPPAQATAIAAANEIPAAPATAPPALPKLTTPETVRVAAPSAVAPLEAAHEPALVGTTTQTETYADPFSYCRAVKTIDYVDNRYSGPAFTDAIAQALLIPPSTARDRVRWRCFEGTVLACTSYVGPVCDMAPTVTEMQEFCRRYPQVDQLMAPSGTWSCADGRPQLPPDASWPIDERGFLPESWVAVPETGGTPAG